MVLPVAGQLLRSLAWPSIALALLPGLALDIWYTAYPKPGHAEMFLSRSTLAGIGKALLDHAKAAMPSGFTLFTTSQNTRARHFYEREGLVALREEPHPRSGHPVTYYEWNGQ